MFGKKPNGQGQAFKLRSIRALCLTLSTIFSVISLSTSSHASDSAGDAILCVKDHLKNKEKDGKIYGITDSEIQLLTNKILQATSNESHRNVVLVACYYGKKAEAWLANGSDPDIPLGEYLIYNPIWVREVSGTSSVQTTAIFGHELGHFIYEHFTTNSALPQIELETEADEFAGCAVAATGKSWAPLEDLFARLRVDEKEISDNYPNRLKSIGAAKKGFDRCKRPKPSIARETTPKRRKSTNDLAAIPQPDRLIRRKVALDDFGCEIGKPYKTSLAPHCGELSN